MIFTKQDLTYIKEAVEERVQLTDWGTKKHRDYRRLLDKLIQSK